MIIRTMRPEDLDFAAESTEIEGWASETREAFAASFDRDPAGCFLAEEDGARLGICVAVSYGAAGFMGELIVRKEGRGRGIGPKLVETALSFLASRGAENVYLDAVERAVPVYEVFGFRPVCPSLRFLGRPTAVGGLRAAQGDGVRPMLRADLEAVVTLDRSAFGADRAFFLERRFSRAPRYAWVAEDGGGLSGYVLGSTGRGLVVAGPWIATSRCPRPAALLERVGSAAGDVPVRVGVLEANAAATAAVRAMPGMKELQASRRMVRGTSDRLGNSPECWGIGSPAKG